MPRETTLDSTAPTRVWGQVAIYIVHLALLFLFSPSLVPGVNESHYLPKSKHAWDPSYAAGGDLFLESHDAHFLASAAAGLAAGWLPLAGVAWLGRLGSWALMAWAWGRWCQSLRIKPILQPMLLIAWFMATQYGHWAGEWAIGGFEAKSIAYPLVLLALAAHNQGNWRAVWLWLGCAVAWHPVVGGWAGLTVGMLWFVGLCRTSQPQRWRVLSTSLPWQLAAVGLGLIGAIPAAAGIGPAVTGAGNVVPAQVHVFYRLAHHMSPQLFAAERHVWAVASLLVLLFTTAAWRWRGRGDTVSASSPTSHPSVTEPKTSSSATSSLSTRAMAMDAGPILAIAWMSVGIAAIGLLIDLGLSARRPDLAAGLLRFYWFRWADVAVPLAWTTTCGLLVQRWSYASSASRPDVRGGVLLAGLAFASCLVVLAHVSTNLQRSYPPADEIVVKSVGPHPIDTDRYLDWLAVCQWIEQNSPTDSLWFTPKYQQSFKWHAGRAEVVCWKDVPQDNAAVLEWYRRVARCQPPRRKSVVREWTTDELLDLSREYGFRWILLDRTVQKNPPALEVLYPIDIENRSFAVCRIPEELVTPLLPALNPPTAEDKPR